MLRSVSGTLAMLALVVSAEAQDTTRMQRALAALSSPPSAEEIDFLATNNQNAYVYFMQDYLSAAGSYGGPVNGQLTNATIRAIVGFCRQAGFAETCIRGPLLPESIALVSQAVAAALAPVLVAAEEQPDAETILVAEAAIAEPALSAEPLVLPDGWRLNENGEHGSLGISAELLAAGTADAVIRFSGTALRRGYFNIELAPMQPSAAGTWSTSVEGSSEKAGDTGGIVWLRTATLSDQSYLGELFPGEQLQGEATVRGSGVAADEVTRLLPYVQLWVEAGEAIDMVLTLRNPQIGKQ